MKKTEILEFLQNVMYEQTCLQTKQSYAYCLGNLEASIRHLIEELERELND